MVSFPVYQILVCPLTHRPRAGNSICLSTVCIEQGFSTICFYETTFVNFPYCFSLKDLFSLLLSFPKFPAILNFLTETTLCSLNKETVILKQHGKWHVCHFKLNILTYLNTFEKKNFNGCQNSKSREMILILSSTNQLQFRTMGCSLKSSLNPQKYHTQNLKM